MKIAGRQIGPDVAPYVIAEIGVNHDGEVGKALELVDAAASAGADAVKLQLFETDQLMSSASRLAVYQSAAGESDPVEMLRRLELSSEDLSKIIEHAHDRSLHAVVSVFCIDLIETALELPWDGLKTASPDVINRPLLESLGASGLPLIVSTGAATLEEIERAMGWLSGCRDRVAVLHCVSSYPTRRDDASLGTIRQLASRLDVPIGYSDHTVLDDTGLLAVSCGAQILEKHITYDSWAPGPDHACSLEPDEFARYVSLATAVHRGEMTRDEVERRIAGDPRLHDLGCGLQDCERDVRVVARQSLVTRRTLPAGHVLTESDLTIKRPGTGLGPFRLTDVVGSTLVREVREDVPLRAIDLGWKESA